MQSYIFVIMLLLLLLLLRTDGYIYCYIMYIIIYIHYNYSIQFPRSYRRSTVEECIDLIEYFLQPSDYAFISYCTAISLTALDCSK